MKILVVDDSEYKIKKIVTLLDSIREKNITYDKAFSYTSGLNKALKNNYDLIILDMSMPTYDKTKNESGGRFRVFGGKEIVRQLKREKKIAPFIILTQYSQFDDTDKIKTLEDLETFFDEKFSEFHISTIFYDTSSSKWKILLEEKISKL
ncbi:MAG: response regulator [Arcobacteraceae bacterium]